MPAPVVSPARRRCHVSTCLLLFRLSSPSSVVHPSSLSSCCLRCHASSVLVAVSPLASPPCQAHHCCLLCQLLSSVCRCRHLSSVIHPPLPPSVIHLVIPCLLRRIRLSVVTSKMSDIPDAAAIVPVLVLPLARRHRPSTAHPRPHRPTCWPPLPRICWIFPTWQLPTR